MTSSMTRIDKVGMWDFEGLKRLKLHHDRDEPETRTAGASGRTLNSGPSMGSSCIVPYSIGKVSRFRSLSSHSHSQFTFLQPRLPLSHAFAIPVSAGTCLLCLG